MADTTAADLPVDDRSPAGRRGLLPAVLLFTMTASSFQIFAIAVLAVDIIDDLGMSRTALGFLGSLNTFVGALTAPAMGRLTDRIGAGRAVVIALVISGVGMAAMALSTTWVLLALSAAIAGVPQGWGNPATNALIAERVPARARGTITGIKQSGVQFGIFLSGFTLPGLALWLGWRGAMWGYAVAFLAGAAIVALTLGPSPSSGTAAACPADGKARRTPLPGFIWAVSAYAFLYGTAGGAIGRFFPLWANEVVGLSTVVAGALVALSGLLGIAARIGAGRLAQDRIGPAKLLSGLACIGAGYCVILLLTTTIGAWVLWPATVLYSVGIGAWNAVAMLAIIVSVPRDIAGRASGVVMLGFLGGLTVGSPAAGAIVDRWGTYQPVWAAALALSVASAILIQPRFSRTDHVAIGAS
jgi:predicted MFS family arabinose efflux permease